MIFRRGDGNVLALPPAMRDILTAFDVPRTLLDAASELWMLGDATVAQLWRTLVEQGILRQVPRCADLELALTVPRM